MRIRIRHKTQYFYDTPAAFGPHVIRLRPAEHTRATVLSYNLEVSTACEVRWQQDPWGNRLARLTFPEGKKVRDLTFTVDAAFDIRPVNPFDFFVDDDCKELPFAYPPALATELAPFLVPAKATPKLSAFVEAVPARGGVVDYLVALNSKVASTVGYIIRNEPGIQSSEETLVRGKGSCRDSAQLLVDTLRSRGLAARFVSGYLVQLADEGNLPDQAKGVATDVVDLHAWAEVYLPGAGWIGLDGTSGLFCGEGHIPLAGAAVPDSAAPVTGTASGPATNFAFELEVVRLGHEPRPRKPYDDADWDAIVETGDAIDAALRAAGVTLTSGGEPTWTSRLHPTEPDWNTEALGPTKRAQGLAMAKALTGAVGTGAAVMSCMGKHYPGEPLPRWALHLIWRKDGAPVWRDPKRLALTPSVDDAEVTVATSRGFIETLARFLRVPPAIVAGYEDPWHFIRQEEQLPPDVDPLSADLKSSDERRRLARVLGRGLGTEVGFALPIARQDGQFVTANWRFRREHMFLLPGESPMGLRMPLDGLEGTAPEPFVQDPSTLIARLPVTKLHPVGTPVPPVVDRAPQSKVVMRTALCVEARDGAIHVFLPPMDETESYLDLVAAVEATAVAHKVNVILEGYPPPSDPRLGRCLVTPDPGVIEVNLPVCENLREYTAAMNMLSEAALHAGLTTEKFQLDGREIGSGGGNHLALGGPTPLQSPWLTRPELLGGLLRYLQNHPSLSFLFTGLFVGPTSQAPRIDEGRHDALVELELALDQIPVEGPAPQPWFIDRLLRNLLTDVAGNTHRTEVCIDKLYDPNSAAGRQGLVEFRAFEMPPHPHMATVQMLLMRAITARLALEPYTAPLVRWGTALHDRFMLPHYLAADIADVVGDLRRVGLSVETSWFQPFLDQRCPVAGTLQLEDILVEVRLALEPWHTLGEQPAGAVVARYVDSSLERVQVKVSGLTPGRHELAVNGVMVPLQPTGTNGEAVAGVRFRAWQPPFCLQPHIGIHHPLRFDIIDTWAKRSLGACSYHVWHPEGRAYDEPPLTIFEAAARRAQRFTTEGHMPWPAVATPTSPHPEHPHTLDLRLHSRGAV